MGFEDREKDKGQRTNNKGGKFSSRNICITIVFVIVWIIFPLYYLSVDESYCIEDFGSRETFIDEVKKITGNIICDIVLKIYAVDIVMFSVCAVIAIPLLYIPLGIAQIFLDQIWN